MIFSARGGSKILCRRLFVRSADKIANGSVAAARSCAAGPSFRLREQSPRVPCKEGFLFALYINAHLCFFHRRMQPGISSRNTAMLQQLRETRAFFRASCVRQQDPLQEALVQEVLHSVCGTIVNASVYRELVLCLISQQIPSCFFCQIFAAKFPLFPVRQPAEPNTKLICVFPQESEAKAAMRQCCSSCGKVVHCFRAWFVQQQDPVQEEALRSFCEKNRQQFHVHRELVFCLVSRQIPSCFFWPNSRGKVPQQDPVQ